MWTRPKCHCLSVDLVYKYKTVLQNLIFKQCVAHTELEILGKYPSVCFFVLRNLNVPFKVHVHINSAAPSSGLKDTESYFSFLP